MNGTRGWGIGEKGNRIPVRGDTCEVVKATPHNSKCRYGERGATDAKQKRR